MTPKNTSRLRLAGWLIVASLIVLIVSVVTFGSVAVRTPEFNQLETVAQVAEYAAQRGTNWVALDLGLLLGAGLTYAGLILIAACLMSTKARIWVIVGLISLRSYAVAIRVYRG